MNTEKARLEAKDKIDQIFNRLEEMERRKDSVSEEKMDSWQQEIENLKKSKETLSTLYDNLKNASEESIDQIKNGFNEIATVMENRMDQMKKSFKTNFK